MTGFYMTCKNTGNMKLQSNIGLQLVSKTFFECCTCLETKSFILEIQNNFSSQKIMEDLSNIHMSLKRNNRLMLDSKKYKGKCFDLWSPIAMKNFKEQSKCFEMSG